MLQLDIQSIQLCFLDDLDDIETRIITINHSDISREQSQCKSIA